MHNFLARRMGRKPYWLLVLLNEAVALFLMWGISFVMRHLMVDDSGRPDLRSYFWVMYPLVLFFFRLPTFVGTIWRLHDTGHRSWPVWLGLSYLLCMIGLAPLMVWAAPNLRLPHISDAQAVMALYVLLLVPAGIVIRTIYLCCLRGDEGPNRYGPPPGGAPDSDLPPALQQDISPQPERPAAVLPRRMISPKPSFGKRGA